MFNKFFPIVDTCLSCEDTARQIVLWCQNDDFWRPVLSASPYSITKDNIDNKHSKREMRLGPV